MRSIRDRVEGGTRIVKVELVMGVNLRFGDGARIWDVDRIGCEARFGRDVRYRVRSRVRVGSAPENGEGRSSDGLEPGLRGGWVDPVKVRRWVVSDGAPTNSDKRNTFDYRC